MNPWKRRLLLETIIFRFHVSFRGVSKAAVLQRAPFWLEVPRSASLVRCCYFRAPTGDVGEFGWFFTKGKNWETWETMGFLLKLNHMHWAHPPHAGCNRHFFWTFILLLGGGYINPTCTINWKHIRKSVRMMFVFSRVLKWYWNDAMRFSILYALGVAETL